MKDEYGLMRLALENTTWSDRVMWAILLFTGVYVTTFEAIEGDVGSAIAVGVLSAGFFGLALLYHAQASLTSRGLEMQEELLKLFEEADFEARMLRQRLDDLQDLVDKLTPSSK